MILRRFCGILDLQAIILIHVGFRISVRGGSHAGYCRMQCTSIFQNKLWVVDRATSIEYRRSRKSFYFYSGRNALDFSSVRTSMTAIGSDTKQRILLWIVYDWEHSKAPQTERVATSPI